MRHVSDLRPYAFNFTAAENGNDPPRLLRQSGNGSQKCSFAGAIVTHDDVKLPGRELRGHSTQRGKASELLD